MTLSLEGFPTKAKKTPSPHEVRMTPLDTNPKFQCLGKQIFIQNIYNLKHCCRIHNIHNWNIHNWIFINIHTESSIQNIHNWMLRIWKNKCITYLKKRQDNQDRSVINQIYLHVKDPNETKYQYLIKEIWKQWFWKPERSTA